MRKVSGLLGALILALGVVSCGGGGDAAGPGGGGGGGGGGGNCPLNTFCLTTSNTFSPLTLTVPVGTIVSFQNDAGYPHNVTWNNATGRTAAAAGDGSGDIADYSNGTHTRVFNTTGTFGFHCTIHAGMTGSLTVQ